MHASSASVNFAISAFEDPPVWTRVAQVTGPLDQSTIRLDHLERVGTVRCYGHGDVVSKLEGESPVDGNSRLGTRAAQDYSLYPTTQLRCGYTYVAHTRSHL
jgi:hypothetical protein